MRRLLLVAALLAITLIAHVQAQDVALPSCTQEQAYQMGILFNEQMSDALESASVKEDLLERAEQASLAYEHWQKNIVPQLPQCRQSLEMQLAVERTVNTVIIFATMTHIAGTHIEADEVEIAERFLNRALYYDERFLIELDALNASAGELSAIAQGVEDDIIIQARPSIYYVNANTNVNIRACGNSECAIVTTARPGQELRIIDDTGSWYELQLDDGNTAYIASFLASKSPPQVNPRPTSPPVQAQPAQSVPQPTQQSQSPAPQVQPTAPPPASQYTCGGDQYNCSNFNSCNQVMTYFNQCPGDPSRLDRDNDGVPCESLCG